MKMSVHQPRIEVSLFKTIKRSTTNGTEPTSSRFQGTKPIISLGPWLGEGSSVSTSKNINAGAGGFSITLVDKPYDRDGLDSLYGIIEPMDIVTIRFRHGMNPTDGDTSMPIVMRGFVSNVSRSENMSPDGKPQRTVTIQGQDYGKIWQMLQIFYGPNYITGEDILSAFKLMDKFGAGFKVALTNVEFLKIAIEQIVNPFLKRLLPDGGYLPQITLDTSHVVEAAVGIAGIQSAEGNIYDLLRRYLDTGPFNELFLMDDEDTVRCVYRQNPALGLDALPLAPKVTDAPSTDRAKGRDDASVLTLITLKDEDILGIDVQRSDSNVANYYWVAAPAFSLNSDVLQRQMGYSAADRASTDLSAYDNCASKLYGMRLMWLNTSLGGKVTNVKSGLTEAEHDRRDGDLNEWIRDRREFVVAQNRDNSILERGSIRISGNEGIRAGNYVQVVRGRFKSIYYVVQVSHQVIPFRGIYTTLLVERGLGFADRIKMGGGVDSPYLSELAR
jgi:hypothetical protein